MRPQYPLSPNAIPDEIILKSGSFPRFTLLSILKKYLSIGIAVLLILGGTAIQSVAQPNFSHLDYLPQSPNAAGLTVYAETPVNLSTGQASISLPLYSLTTKTLSCNAQLSYNTHGLKLQDEASNVGLNWSLILGGVITRTVQDLDDHSGPAGYHFFDFDDTRPEDIIAAAQQLYDTEPDVYNFNFAGRTGKFVMRRNYEVQEYVQSELEFSYCEDDDTWIIVDESGTIYRFEELEIGSFDPSTCTTIDNALPLLGTTAWYLTSITSHDFSDEILYTYGHRRTQARADIKSASRFLTDGGTPPRDCETTDCQSTIQNCRVSHSVSTVELTQVQTARHTLKLSYSDRDDIELAMKLDKITLYDKTGQDKLKECELSYDYYTAGATSKLRLIGLQEKGAFDNQTGDIIPLYVFTYGSSSLADPDGFSVDHWGYQNSSINTNLLPPDALLTPGEDFGNTKRKADSKSWDGLLTRIDYPTGWFKEFTYENNDYGHLMSDQFPTSNPPIQERVEITHNSNSVMFEVCEEFPTVRINFVLHQCIDPLSTLGCANSFGIEDSNGTPVFGKLGLVSNEEFIYMFEPGIHTISSNVNTNTEFTISVDYYQRDIADINGRIAGGARISAITDPDGTTTYEYRAMDSLRSSGILIDVPSYILNEGNYVSCHIDDCGSYCGGTQLNSSSLTSSFSSSHIQYTDVIETHPDESVSYYKFDFKADDSPNGILGPDNLESPLVHNTSNENERGNLILKEEYVKEVSGVLRKVSEEHTDWLYVKDPFKAISAYGFFDTQPFCAPMGASDIRTNIYSHNVVTVQRQQTISTVHGSDDNTTVSTTQTMDYDDEYPSLMSSESVVNSDGKTYTTEYFYTDQYPSGIVKNGLLDQNRILPAWQSIKNSR